MEMTVVMLHLLVMKTYRKEWFYGSVCHFLDREETAYDGRPMYSLKLIISEVHSEDYEQPFVCQASNAFGQVASYIILKHRGKEYCCFSLAFIEVMWYWFQMLVYHISRRCMDYTFLYLSMWMCGGEESL